MLQVQLNISQAVSLPLPTEEFGHSSGQLVQGLHDARDFPMQRLQKRQEDGAAGVPKLCWALHQPY